MKFTLSRQQIKFYHAYYVVVGLLMVISLIATYTLTGELLIPLVKWVFGLGTLFLFSRLDYRKINVLSVPLLIIALIILAITIFAGSGGGGRSISIGGLSIQTFYIVTVLLVLYLSTSCARKLTLRGEISNMESINLLILFGAFTGMIALRNISTAILLFFTGISILYVAKINLKYMGIFILFIALSGGVYIGKSAFQQKKQNETELNKESKTRGSTAYNRIKYWMSGESEIEGYGRQMTLAQTAVARSAKAPAPGKGIIKNKMSEGENDFVFSLICEELSIFVGFLLVILYFILFFNATYTSRKASGNFVKLYALGIGLLIIGQATIHIATNVNVMPATGQTLPLISRGDTAFLITCGLIGTLINMSKMVANNADDDSEFIVK